MQKEQPLVSNDHITGQYEIFLSKLKPKEMLKPIILISVH